MINGKDPFPKPCRCCGRTPVIVKIRPHHWRVACPYLDCDYVNAYGETEADAIMAWNAENWEEQENEN